MNEVMHTCPRCGNTKISEKAIEYCDDCHGVDNSIMTMRMGGQVFTCEVLDQNDYMYLQQRQ